MSIKDILVHVDPAPVSAGRLHLVADLARRYGAHMIGVGLGDTTAEGIFRTTLQGESLAGEWRPTTGTEESLASFVTRHARAADLVVLGQYASDLGVVLDSPEDVILACGRPVLIVPCAGRFERVGATVLIAWNGGRESMRAVHDTLPLMGMAAAVTVLSVDPDPDEDWGTDDVVQHLVRHGLNAKAETQSLIDLTPSEAVLSRAADLGADFIVMGAYGHSWVREVILGGMTQEILSTMTVPVLMAH
ncbi:universal stress protein [Azospirillum brasilense]|uniref:universal stress protein n=1 Tax=Azospirillum brasilense TaxID=192 RepID=UPI001EDA7C38|nr:universal stress protein [Azospirillum brasilense]UKJ76479.1 universal stress protein [Azospirillum brasilense]